MDTMLRRNVLLTVVLLACGSVAARGAGPATIETHAPDGRYASLWLTLEGAAWPITKPNESASPGLRIFVGLRDGRGTTAWICGPVAATAQPFWIDENTVAWDGAKLAGGLRGVRHDDHEPFAYEFAAAGAADGLRGTYVASVGAKKVSGTLVGRQTTAEESAHRDGLAAGRDWPRYHGATGGMQGPEGGTKLIEDFAAIRPVWKSEEHVPCGWGNAPDYRYGPRAVLAKRPAGGTSSPVVADGVVYQAYYVPAGDGVAPPAWDTETWDKGWNNPQQIRLHGGGGPFPKAALDFNAPSADEVVVALDAATGRTLWRTVSRRTGWNLQTHKWRGMNPAPTVRDGRVFHVGYAGYVFALDARTGRPVWRYAGTHRPQQKSGGYYGSDGAAGVPVAGPLVAGDVVVVSGRRPKGSPVVVALDAKSGTERWVRENLAGRTQLWTHEGRDHVIVAFEMPRDGAGGLCLDAATGETRFPLPAEACATHGFLPLVAGDFLLGVRTERKGYEPNAVGFACVKLAPAGATVAWTVENRSDGDQWAAALSETHAYLTDPRGLRVFETSSGRAGAELPQGDGHRTQLAFLGGGRLFVQPEGRHGSQGFKMFDLFDPSRPRPLGAADRNRTLLPDGTVQFDAETLWRPPHPYTTAYAVHPLAYPLVDGRLFVRGNGGVYCYDMRATK